MMSSAELHRQLHPYKEELRAKDQENKMLKKTISDRHDKLDQLEQCGRRDSLKVSGIPAAVESDDTDTSILSLCTATKVDPPEQPEDIAVSHRIG